MLLLTPKLYPPTIFQVKSINSCKSFEPLSSLAPLQQWLGVLAAELAERMAEDEAEHARRPRSLGKVLLCML
jgi:hypothetical protein